MLLMAAQRFNIRLPNQNLTNEDILRPYNHCIKADGSIAVLMGSLAPEGSFIRHAACLKEGVRSVLHARPFGSKKKTLDAIPTQTQKSELHPDCGWVRFLLYRKIEDE